MSVCMFVFSFSLENNQFMKEKIESQRLSLIMLKVICLVDGMAERNAIWNYIKLNFNISLPTSRWEVVVSALVKFG